MLGQDIECLVGLAEVDVFASTPDSVEAAFDEIAIKLSGVRCGRRPA
jgi:hypothetical protein